MTADFRLYSASEAIKASNSGEVDAESQRIDGLSRTFSNLIQIPIPINIIQGSAFSTKYRFPVTGWHSLRPYRIGIVRGIVFAEQPTRGMKVTVAESYQALVDLLENDQVDVGIMPRIEGLETIHSTGYTDVVEMEGVLETLFLYHYVHSSRTDLVQQLSPVLKSVLLSGETRRIQQQAIHAMKFTE